MKNMTLTNTKQDKRRITKERKAVTTLVTLLFRIVIKMIKNLRNRRVPLKAEKYS